MYTPPCTYLQKPIYIFMRTYVLIQTHTYTRTYSFIHVPTYLHTPQSAFFYVKTADLFVTVDFVDILFFGRRERVGSRVPLRAGRRTETTWRTPWWFTWVTDTAVYIHREINSLAVIDHDEYVSGASVSSYLPITEVCIYINSCLSTYIHIDIYVCCSFCKSIHMYVVYLSSTDDHEDVCLHIKSVYVKEEESADTFIGLSPLLLPGVNDVMLLPYHYPLWWPYSLQRI